MGWILGLIPALQVCSILFRRWKSPAPILLHSAKRLGGGRNLLRGCTWSRSPDYRPAGDWAAKAIGVPSFCLLQLKAALYKIRERERVKVVVVVS